jgi:MYXO-CTERM domain-containing protein
MTKKLAVLGLVLLFALGLSVNVYAQDQGTGTTGTTYEDTRDDNDTDWGWIGLLGLAGLLGLRRREPVHRDVRTTAPAR